MNRLTVLCAAALAAAALLSAPAAVLPAGCAYAEESAVQALQTAKNANMRVEPSTRSELRAKLDKGTRVEVMDTTEIDGETWAYIRVKNRRTGSITKGYIMMNLLEPIPTPTPVPTPSPTPTPSPVPTPTPEPTPVPTADPNAEAPEANWGKPDNVRRDEEEDVVANETVYEEPGIGRTLKNVNIRKTPGGKRLTQIDSDEDLTLLGEADMDGELWLHVIVKRSGMEGYMLSEYVRQLRPATLVEVSAESVLERFPVIPCDPIGEIQSAEPFEYTDEELAQYRTLGVGDVHEEVRRIKRRLYELGYFKKVNDNPRYTESTADVIKIFQRENGLPVTGESDPHTQAMLFDERVLAREGSEQEIKYLDNRSQPLYIQKAEITSFSFHGSVQVSVRNNSGGKLTAFGLKIIPYYRTGEAADMAETFEEEMQRVYSIDDISIPNGRNYSDFWEPEDEDDGGDDYDDVVNDYPGLEDYTGPAVHVPHHFQVSNQVYFSSAQVAVSWYRVNGKKVYVDDDQMVFVGVDYGVGDSLIHTLPIEVSRAERENADWKMGVSTQYVLPVYQEHYELPQGAYVMSVTNHSPMADAGIEAGDIIVGIGDITILGDATLRKARGSIDAGKSAEVVFWRDGVYYSTEVFRPEAVKE